MSDPRTGDLLSFCVPIGAAVAAGWFFPMSVPGSAVAGLLRRSSWPKNILCSSLETRQVAVGGLQVSWMLSRLRHLNMQKTQNKGQILSVMGLLAS